MQIIFRSNEEPPKDRKFTLPDDIHEDRITRYATLHVYIISYVDSA